MIEEMIREIRSSVLLLRDIDSIGTGFVISDGGHILTCNHVVQKDEIKVITDSGEIYTLTTLARLPKCDLSILHCPDIKEKPLYFSDPMSIAEGQTVFALGHPLGFEFTISRGIVSSRERIVSGVSYVQIDASINPGNSGGPVVNEKGEVVGIADWGIKESQGLSFAVAVRHALAFSAQLRVPVKRSATFMISTEK